MAYIKADSDKEQRHFDFLEDLRQSGETNMFGASPYLAAAFSLSAEKARATLSKWMRLHDDKGRILKKPLSKTKVTASVKSEMVINEERR